MLFPLQLFLQPLQPVCNPFATFYFLCKSAEKPVVMRFLRYILIFATFATYFQGLCGKIKNKKSFLYIQGPSKIGCKGCKCKYARCKPAWYKGFRLVDVFFERLQIGCKQVAKVAILQPFDLSHKKGILTMLFPIIQERNSDHVATSATFLPPLPPFDVCHFLCYKKNTTRRCTSPTVDKLPPMCYN